MDKPVNCRVLWFGDNVVKVWHREKQAKYCQNCRSLVEQVYAVAAIMAPNLWYHRRNEAGRINSQRREVEPEYDNALTVFQVRDAR